MAIERTSPRVRGNNAQASPDFNDQTHDRICPGRPPASTDRGPVTDQAQVILPAAVFGPAPVAADNNCGPEIAIGREDRACDPARMAVASSGNRATACDPTVRMVVPTVVPAAQIFDPVIAGPI
jgi:hypothetical protein